MPETKPNEATRPAPRRPRARPRWPRRAQISSTHGPCS